MAFKTWVFFAEGMFCFMFGGRPPTLLSLLTPLLTHHNHSPSPTNQVLLNGSFPYFFMFSYTNKCVCCCCFVFMMSLRHYCRLNILLYLFRLVVTALLKVDFRSQSHSRVPDFYSTLVKKLTLKKTFPFDILKKTQGERNSKLNISRKTLKVHKFSSKLHIFW